MADFFSIEVDGKRLSRQLTALEREVLPRAEHRSVNLTARAVLDANRSYMQRAFNQPSRFTLNAFFARYAPRGANKPAASVERKSLGAQKRGVGAASGFRSKPPSQRHFLEVQSRGGARPHTGLEGALRSRGVIERSEYLVPARSAPRNAAGSVRPGTVLQIMSQLQAAELSAGAQANETKASADRRKRRGGARVFVQRGRSPGIYRRTGKRAPVKLFHIIDGAPRYRARFAFEDHALRAARMHYPRFLQAEIARRIKRVR